MKTTATQLIYENLTNLFYLLHIEGESFALVMTNILWIFSIVLKNLLQSQPTVAWLVSFD